MHDRRVRLARVLRRFATVTGAIMGVVALATVAFANVPLTPVSQDPYTNTNPDVYHQTEVEPDTFAYGSTIVSVFRQHRLGHVGRRRGILDPRLPPQDDGLRDAPGALRQNQRSLGRLRPEARRLAGAVAHGRHQEHRAGEPLHRWRPHVEGTGDRLHAGGIRGLRQDVDRMRHAGDQPPLRQLLRDLGQLREQRHLDDEHLERRREDVDAGDGRPRPRPRRPAGGAAERQRGGSILGRCRPDPVPDLDRRREDLLGPLHDLHTDRSRCDRNPDRAAALGRGRRTGEGLRGVAGLPVPQWLLGQRHRNEHVQERNDVVGHRSHPDRRGCQHGRPLHSGDRRRYIDVGRHGAPRADVLLLPDGRLLVHHLQAGRRVRQLHGRRRHLVIADEDPGRAETGLAAERPRPVRRGLHLDLDRRGPGDPGDRQRHPERVHARAGRLVS